MPHKTADAASFIQVGRYQLVPLRAIRRDNIRPLLGDAPGVYICNCPEPAWYGKFGLQRKQNLGVEKKRRMFAQMAPGSMWLSMTDDEQVGGSTHTWTSPSGIVHLGRGALRGRAAQLCQLAGLQAWLLRHRQRYDYCYVYNFDLPQFVAPLAVKWLTSKRLLVDYEDDYTTFRQSSVKNLLERCMRTTVDGVVCVNEHMQRYFPADGNYVINSFANLDYTAKLDFTLSEGMTFLFSSRLDAIRGADLLPALVAGLRQRLRQFTIRVTGGGPLRDMVQGLRLSEVDYLGFVDDATLASAIDAADACLVLQKPDHPFSKGSYPCKIDAYAALHKPIYTLAVPAA